MKAFRIKLRKKRRSMGAKLHYLLICLLTMFCSFIKINQGQNKILVIDFFVIGDAVTVTPFIKNLKMNLQNTKIDVLCSGGGTQDVYKKCEYIDKIIIFNEKINRENKEALTRLKNKIKYYKKLVMFCYKSLNGKYNTVFVPRWDYDDERSADIAKLSGATQRVGFSESTTKDKAYINLGRDSFFTQVYSCRPDCLESDKYLNLLEQAGFTIYDTSIKLPFNHITSFKGVDLSIPYAVLALETSNEEKDWNIKNFAYISKYLKDKGIEPVLLGIKQSSEELFKKFGGKGISLIGNTSISETFDIIGSSEFYLGGDTGLSHIAGAVGTCGIVINGYPKDGDPCHPRSPERFRPQSKLIKVLQPKKGSGVNLVLVEDVIEEIDKIFPEKYQNKEV